MAATKLLLVEDVEDLGRSGEIVSVKPGYARNKLLPSGAAVLADKKALRMQAKLQEERAQKAISDKADAEKLKAQIEAFRNQPVERVMERLGQRLVGSTISIQPWSNDAAPSRLQVETADKLGVVR